MRVHLSGGGGFLGAAIEAALIREGHQIGAEPAEAVIQLGPEEVRRQLDRAHGRGSRLFVFLSSLGADARARFPQLASRGRAEELVRAAGLHHVILRPEIIWGSGDIFVTEIAHLLRHLPFIPVPRTGPVLAPIYVGDVARLVVSALDRPHLKSGTWSLVGPEALRYSDVFARVAAALGLDRRRVPVPGWSVRWGAALQERLAHRPPAARALLDRLVARKARGMPGDPFVIGTPLTAMTVPFLRRVLGVATHEPLAANPA